jgi:hypothetical protein
MERHDTTMRAARYLLGAGTFAVAMLATTGSASAQTTVCYGGGEGDPTIFCGHVFTDGNNDGNWDSPEGVGGVVVAITEATTGNNVANSPTPSSECDPAPAECGEFGGFYTFHVPEAPIGTEYWICIITDPNEDDCRDTTAHPEAVKVTVGTGLPYVDFEVGDDGGEEPLPTDDVWGVGTGTPGYWKNHWEAWPDSVTVGGVTYVKDKTQSPNIWDAIAKMGKVSKDKSITMFASLISAKLNTMLANNKACIETTIVAADAWMGAHPVGSGVLGASAAWAVGEPLHQLMDDYNNGKLCAPHRN